MHTHTLKVNIGEEEIWNLSQRCFWQVPDLNYPHKAHQQCKMSHPFLTFHQSAHMIVNTKCSFSIHFGINTTMKKFQTEKNHRTFLSITINLPRLWTVSLLNLYALLLNKEPWMLFFQVCGGKEAKWFSAAAFSAHTYYFYWKVVCYSGTALKATQKIESRHKMVIWQNKESQQRRRQFVTLAIITTFFLLPSWIPFPL